MPRADHVKQAHKGAIKADKKAKDTWLDKEVYSKTRHPNYLGEGMVHVGSLLCGLPAMNGALQVLFCSKFGPKTINHGC